MPARKHQRQEKRDRVQSPLGRMGSSAARVWQEPGQRASAPQPV